MAGILYISNNLLIFNHFYKILIYKMVLGMIVYETVDLAVSVVKLGYNGIAGVYNWYYKVEEKKRGRKKKKKNPQNKTQKKKKKKRIYNQHGNAKSKYL
jgi:hypothetical protein